MKLKIELKNEERKILDDITSHGGRVFFVGGLIRDLLIYQKSDYHDVDVEIYNLDIDTLESILSKYGTVKTVGKSFGILKLSTVPNFDFALPRVEKKVGKTHRDFEVLVDKNLPLEKAALRRDITINALMVEYQTSLIYDFYGGLDDIEHQVIRYVNEETFKEDPLRVLRVAQFASRLEFFIEAKTKKLCASMVENKMLDDLSSERIFNEYNKLLMANRPSIGLKFLNDIKGLPKCLLDLQNTNQRLDYHPEGNVLNHTILVVDLAALCKHKTSNPLGFMWGALLHDIGKPIVTTPEGHAPKHDLIGLDVFRQDMNSIIQDKDMRKYIRCIIHYHMRLSNMTRNNAGDYSYLMLLKKIDGIMPIEDLILITKCDKLGRLRDGSQDIKDLNNYVSDKMARLGTKALAPVVDGDVLISLGYTPNDDFKEILNWAYDLQLRNHSKAEIVAMIKRDERWNTIK